MSDLNQICAICKNKINGYGNNPLPIIEGRCCDECNDRIVVPFRIRHSFAMEEFAKNIEEAVLRNAKRN